MPIAIHGIDSRLRAAVISGLAAQGRGHRVVYNSPNVAGQLAVAVSEMPVAIITQNSLPTHLKALNSRHGLPDLPTVEVALVRSKDTKQFTAVNAMYEHVARSLRGA